MVRYYSQFVIDLKTIQSKQRNNGKLNCYQQPERRYSDLQKVQRGHWVSSLHLLTCLKCFSRNEIMNFCNKIVATKAAKETPIIQLAGVSFIHTTHNDITLIAATKGNINAALTLHFLNGFIKVTRSYFDSGELNESAVRQNFSLIYELLDEVMDYGYPQLLDANLLKEYIRTGSQKKQPTDLERLKAITVQATGAISWRAEGIRYKRNEVFIDIIESVNVLLSSRGTVLKADVNGRVCVKAMLSGMPECKFGVNDKLLMKTGEQAAKQSIAKQKPLDKGIQIDDIKFHQCVRLGRFDRDRSITFIPPDGIFDVMTYRISENINLPFKIVPVVQEYPEQNKIELSIRLKAIFEESNFGTNVVCKIPVPANTA